MLVRLGGRGGDHVYRPRTRLDLELTATDDGIPTDCVVNLDTIDAISRSDFRRQSVKRAVRPYPAFGDGSTRVQVCGRSVSPDDRAGV